VILAIQSAEHRAILFGVGIIVIKSQPDGSLSYQSVDPETVTFTPPPHKRWACLPCSEKAGTAHLSPAMHVMHDFGVVCPITGLSVRVQGQ
jgi:hypothetical protein